jgi:hypothetical protein
MGASAHPTHRGSGQLENIPADRASCALSKNGDPFHQPFLLPYCDQYHVVGQGERSRPALSKVQFRCYIEIMKNKLALATLIFTVTFVVSPLFTSPFSGFRSDQLPIPQIDPPIQPAGYAFSIWGLIYGWLLVSAIYGLLRRPRNKAWNEVRKPLVVSLILGTPWLAVANVSAVWSTVLIFAMAAAAIAAVLAAPKADRYWLRAPVSIYAGWLTAASFVALGSTAAGYGLLMGALGWAYLGIIAALAVAALVQIRARAPGYGLTVIWALFAIIMANGTGNLGVSLLAGAGITVMTILTITTTGRSIS